VTWAPGPVVTRRRLGDELRRLRDRSGMKLEDVARTLECSPSKISRLETGKGIPRLRDIRDMLDAYRVPDGEQRERLLEWARTGQAPMWWSQYADVLPPGLDTYVEYEWDAARICAYEPYLVHGLLQTREYATAVLSRVWGIERSQDDIERMVEVRMQRQEALRPEHGLMFRCILDESTLYRVAGSPAALRTQLEHLLEAAAADHVDLRVLPFSAGLVAANIGPFAKLEFSAGLESGLVHVETATALIIWDPVEIASYERRLTEILEAAYSEAQSVPLIERAIRSVDRGGPA
jgi:transcriptional regulator with XRE-family HTH domain